jgi:hypothetical protein
VLTVDQGYISLIGNIGGFSGLHIFIQYNPITLCCVLCIAGLTLLSVSRRNNILVGKVYADTNDSLVALQSGGFTYPWRRAYVLCPLIIGILLIVAFVLWEWKGARNSMVPKEIFAGQRIVGLVFRIAFVSGMNFYVILTFFL